MQRLTGLVALAVLSTIATPAVAERKASTPATPARTKVDVAALARGIAALPGAQTIANGGNRRHDGGAGSGHSMAHACVAGPEAPLDAIGRRHFEEWEPVITDDGTGGTVVTQRSVRTWLEVRVPCGAGSYLALRCIFGDCPANNPIDLPPPPGIEVARLAAEYAPYEIPGPILSPPLTQLGAIVLVGLPFFWAIDPSQWHDIHATGRACVGTACTTATITAHPTELYFTPGDKTGDVHTCHRPGDVVRTAEAADAAGSDCAYIFQSRGPFEGAVGIHYEIRFTADDGSAGALAGREIEVAVDLPVTEVQPVIVG